VIIEDLLSNLFILHSQACNTEIVINVKKTEMLHLSDSSVKNTFEEATQGKFHWRRRVTACLTHLSSVFKFLKKGNLQRILIIKEKPKIEKS